MIKKTDFFTRRLKYTFPAKRKIKFEFGIKKYESGISFNEKINFNDFLTTFFKENYKKLDPNEYEFARGNNFIPKSNLVGNSTFKETYKIIGFYLNSQEILKKDDLNEVALNLGLNPGGFYDDEKALHGNFFNYLKQKIDPRRYQVSGDLIKNKEHVIKTSFNNPISRLLQENFFKKMKELPNSGYDKMGKFIIGVHDKEYYKIFMSNLLNHMIDITKENGSEGFKIEIDYVLKGFFTPEKKVDLLMRKLDNSLIIPVSFARHTNDIKDYKKFLEENLYLPKEISISNEEKNKKSFDPPIEKRIAMNRKIDIGEYVYKNQFYTAFEAFENHSFDNYNLLKIKSKFRTQIGKKMHFGLAFVNDKFRFQLYVSHPDNRLTDITSITKSRTFSFDVDPYTNSLTNTLAIKDFVDHISLIEKIDDDELYNHFLYFEKLHKDKYYIEKNIEVPINLTNIKNKINSMKQPISEKKNEFSETLEKFEFEILKKISRQTGKLNK